MSTENKNKPKASDIELPIRIILVDDQKLIRDGIKSLFQLTDAIEVIGECADGSEVLSAINELQPDVLLLDLSMPKMNGIDTLKCLREQECGIPTLVLTTFDEPDLILQSIQHGAKGFLLKDVDLETLIEAIEHLNEGKTYFQPSITAKLVSASQKMSGDFSMPKEMEALSDKETEVLRLVASGYSNKEIARMLNKSEGTIKNHVSNVLSKMGVRDRTRAVLLAIEKGILH